MIKYSPDRVRRAVETVCAEIEARVLQSTSELPSDSELWWELSCCLLSSQVPYTMAVAAADAIHRAYPLERIQARNVSSLAQAIEAILREPLRMDCGLRRYRFPAARARQLAFAHQILSDSGGLRCVVSAFDNAASARAWLAHRVPGLGPKQASMFLRNSGFTYRLAILDRHVLDYMMLQDLLLPGARSPTGLNAYLEAEARLRTHAEDLGFAVGMFDWAVWIVMRAAKGLTESRELAA